MRKFEDLRFAIGLFFLIVGVLLLIAGFQSETAEAATLNLRSGTGIAVFGALALGASFWGRSDGA